MSAIEIIKEKVLLKKYFCEICNNKQFMKFTTFFVHCNGKVHKNKSIEKFGEKYTNEYLKILDSYKEKDIFLKQKCGYCNYETYIISGFKSHLKSKRHLNNVKNSSTTKEITKSWGELYIEKLKKIEQNQKKTKEDQF